MICKIIETYFEKRVQISILLCHTLNYHRGKNGNNIYIIFGK